jgi:hypothetical protein
MKLIELDNSTQVRDTNGRLVATFPTPEAAKAFQSGYESGIRDSAERFTRRSNELLNEFKGMVK